MTYTWLRLLAFSLCTKASYVVPGNKYQISSMLVCATQTSYLFAVVRLSLKNLVVRYRYIPSAVSLLACDSDAVAYEYIYIYNSLANTAGL